eukprot:GHVS01065680.1.p1 GENE.GHVS01065680.1~~GHVS01065680.1.p1  ORF type:complete len:374 (-),score=44.35 GHVS01065680.1:188-1309(-)
MVYLGISPELESEYRMLVEKLKEGKKKKGGLKKVEIFDNRTWSANEQRKLAFDDFVHYGGGDHSVSHQIRERIGSSGEIGKEYEWLMEFAGFIEMDGYKEGNDKAKVLSERYKSLVEEYTQRLVGSKYSFYDEVPYLITPCFESAFQFAFGGPTTDLGPYGDGLKPVFSWSWEGVQWYLGRIWTFFHRTPCAKGAVETFYKEFCKERKVKKDRKIDRRRKRRDLDFHLAKVHAIADGLNEPPGKVEMFSFAVKGRTTPVMCLFAFLDIEKFADLLEFNHGVSALMEKSGKLQMRRLMKDKGADVFIAVRWSKTETTVSSSVYSLWNGEGEDYRERMLQKMKAMGGMDVLGGRSNFILMGEDAKENLFKHMTEL